MRGRLPLVLFLLLFKLESLEHDDIEFKADDGWEGGTGSDTPRRGGDPEGRSTLSGMEHSFL